MTEILIISHSREIASGTKALIEQMAEGVTVHASGGVGDGIGTNIGQIDHMLSEVESDTICFFDIGSSLMNLEMAVEMYEGEHDIRIANAPIVEGSFLAAIEISIGKNIDEIMEELNKMVK